MSKVWRGTEKSMTHGAKMLRFSQEKELLAGRAMINDDLYKPPFVVTDVGKALLLAGKPMTGETLDSWLTRFYFALEELHKNV